MHIHVKVTINMLSFIKFVLMILSIINIFNSTSKLYWFIVFLYWTINFLYDFVRITIEEK